METQPLYYMVIFLFNYIIRFFYRCMCVSVTTRVILNFNRYNGNNSVAVIRKSLLSLPLE